MNQLGYYLMHDLNLYCLSEQRLENLKMSSCVSSVHNIEKYSAYKTLDI